MRCSRCRFENPEGFKFCGECGSPLSHQAGLRKFKKRIEPERRQLTVMFCDLVGSTKLSEQFDPEDFHHIITSYQEQCGKIIHRFDGYMAQYLGDGILAYFGYPTAREDDARRAVAAASDIRDVLYRYEIPDLEFEKPLQVRIGIHRGNVIVGEIGGSLRSEQLAIGSVPNVAALIQNMADPGDILISAPIYQLVHGYYSCRGLISKKNRGIPATIKLYRVEEQRRSLTRFESSISARLTRLVGREAELETLAQCWRDVKNGNRVIALIGGEAGIGKSRIVHEFKESIRPEPHTDIECQCWETKRNSPFSPIIDSLKRKFDIDDVNEDRI
jgi:class 3 adenylate cyclase